MTESARCPNSVANFWEWYQRRQKRGRGPMARYSLDKCEESYRRSDWESFGYWFEIYLRERPRTPNSMRTTFAIRANGGASRCRQMAVRPEGANHQWRRIARRELSIDLEADERPGRVTGRAGAS